MIFFPLHRKEFQNVNPRMPTRSPMKSNIDQDKSRSLSNHKLYGDRHIHSDLYLLGQKVGNKVPD